MNNNYKRTIYACYLGSVTQAIINNLLPILFIIFNTTFQISFEMLGRLILINFSMQLAVDIFAAKYADKIGYRVSIVTAHFFSAAGLICLGILPNILDSPFMGLVISIAIYAVGGGFIEVLVSPIVDSIPDNQSKTGSMSLLHSFYCWGQVGVVLISTVIIRIFGSSIWYLLPIAWAIVPLFNMFQFLKVPITTPVSGKDKTPFKQLLSSPIFLTALLLMLCAGASELAMSQWASLFAEKGLNVPKILGDILGPCLFGVLMGIGRVLHGIFGERIDLNKTLVFSSFLCVLCYLTTALVQNPLISLISCAACGLSVSMMWPGLFSLTSKQFPNGGTAMFGMLAVFGDIGCSIGPWIAGLISDVTRRAESFFIFDKMPELSSEQIGLKTGILASSIFPAIMFFAMLFVLIIKKRKLYHNEKL